MSLTVLENDRPLSKLQGTKWLVNLEASNFVRKRDGENADLVLKAVDDTGTLNRCMGETIDYLNKQTGSRTTENVYREATEAEIEHFKKRSKELLAKRNEEVKQDKLNNAQFVLQVAAPETEKAEKKGK